MCWYVSSAEKRENLPFYPSDLDTSLCTHLIYSYSIIDPETVNLQFLPNEDVRSCFFYEVFICKFLSFF